MKIKILSELDKIKYRNDIIILGKQLDNNAEYFINKYLNNNEFICFGIFNEEEIIGFCVVIDHSLFLNLYSFIIREDYQLKGIGSLFLKNIEQILFKLCSKHEVKNIAIILSSNEIISKFYRKNGYKFIYNLERKNKNSLNVNESNIEMVLFKEINQFIF